MKNLFKFVCIIAFLAGGLAFGQSQKDKKHRIEVIYCKKFHVSVGIGVITVDTDVTGCLVKIDGLPLMIWSKNAENQDDGKIEYLYVKEEELMKELNVKDSKDLENMKIIKSGIWDYEGEDYVIDTNAAYEVFEFEGIKYYAFHLQKAK